MPSQPTAPAYKLPGGLSAFQKRLYEHLIAWKHRHISLEPGYLGDRAYDALLPASIRPEEHLLYPPIRQRFVDHQKRFFFKFHRYLNHMASSQAACANLFLPLFLDPVAGAQVLRAVKPDLQAIATEYLDGGFRIEFWDEPDNLLQDHNRATGTDADMAIAYYDHQGQLKLWLIEHKLTEREFTACGAYRSKGRTQAYRCAPASDVLASPSLCYYHGKNGYQYWNIMLREGTVFDLQRIAREPICPFRGGTGQLWRNMLMAKAIEDSASPAWTYQKVFFSVAYHPENPSLTRSMNAFKELIGHNERFFSFTSDKLVKAATESSNSDLIAWAQWYQELYFWKSYF